MATISLTTPADFPIQPLYQNQSVEIKVAQQPLSIRAVDISLRQNLNLSELSEENFSDFWEARYIAEAHLDEAGYRNRLCYAKLDAKSEPVWQTTAYSELPSYLDNWVIRKIYSIWQQAKVLFRTIFPNRPSDAIFEEESSFWSDFKTEAIDSNNKTGTGALTKEEVIDTQIVFPNKIPSSDNDMLLLYNYAPLRTGGEQMHFLIIPNPAKPAKNFLELDKDQYIQVLKMAQQVTLWANDTFEEPMTLHFFDKSGEIAGQTQPLFHANLIIVKNESEAMWGRIAMFFRMLFPASPLPSKELERRVTHYRESLGHSLNKK